MIKLYHCERARSLRVLWTLEEAGLLYELKLLRFPPRESEPGFLEENPIGTVPLLVDGDLRMTESSAICEYLVSRYGPSSLARTPDSPEFGDWLEWLYYGEATLTYPLAVALRWGQMAPPEERLPQVVNDRVRKFLDRLTPLERQLGSHPWLLPGGFSVADISVAYSLFLADRVGIGGQLPVAVAAYWQRCQTRPAFRRAMTRSRAQAV